MKLNKFAYSKPLGNHTLKIMKKSTWKFTLKNHGNIMEFCQSEKVGTLTIILVHKLQHCRRDDGTAGTRQYQLPR